MFSLFKIKKIAKDLNGTYLSCDGLETIIFKNGSFELLEDESIKDNDICHTGIVCYDKNDNIFLELKYKELKDTNFTQKRFLGTCFNNDIVRFFKKQSDNVYVYKNNIATYSLTLNGSEYIYKTEFKSVSTIEKGTFILDNNKIITTGNYFYYAKNDIVYEETKIEEEIINEFFFTENNEIFKIEYKKI